MFGVFQVEVHTVASAAQCQATEGSSGGAWPGHHCCWRGQQWQPLADQMLVTVERGHTC